jgi:hypothetical protein
MALARKQVTRGGVAASRPLPDRAPALVAVERLAKLAVAGAPAPRMVAAACAIVGEWRDGAMPPGMLMKQLEALQTEIDDGLAAAEDYVAEADEADKPRARFQLDALRATQRVLKAEAERLP